MLTHYLCIIILLIILKYICKNRYNSFWCYKNNGMLNNTLIMAIITIYLILLEILSIFKS